MSPIRPSKPTVKLQVGIGAPDPVTLPWLSQVFLGEGVSHSQVQESFVEQDGTPHTVYTHTFTPPNPFLQFTNGSQVFFHTQEEEEKAPQAPLWKHGVIVEGTLTEKEE